MLTKLQKWGNSQGIRIPKQILSTASFTEGEDVEIVAEYDRIIIKHAEKPIKKYRIEELFTEYGTGGKQKEEEWGGPSGREEW